MRRKQTVKLTAEAAAELAGNRGKTPAIDMQDENQVANNGSSKRVTPSSSSKEDNAAAHARRHAKEQRLENDVLAARCRYWQALQTLYASLQSHTRQLTPEVSRRKQSCYSVAGPADEHMWRTAGGGRRGAADKGAQGGKGETGKRAQRDAGVAPPLPFGFMCLCLKKVGKHLFVLYVFWGM